MIVHTPTKTIKDGNVFLKSRFEMRRSVPYFPLELWYRFPERFFDHLSLRADAFAPTALLVAMYTGEDLFIKGAISPRLAYSLFEYRNIYHSWNPKLFQQVDIQYDQVELSSQPNRATAVATAFSGGVDSFYTLWSHLPQNQPISVTTNSELRQLLISRGREQAQKFSWERTAQIILDALEIC